MIRRQARQRRDYLHRRAQLLRTAETASRRALHRQSLLSNNTKTQPPLTATNHNDELDPADAIDDEYTNPVPILPDPRPLLTTSRSPSTRLLTFTKELRLLFPTATRINRGKLILPELGRACAAAGVSDALVVHEHRGIPTALTVGHLPHGPVVRFALANVVLRADIPRLKSNSDGEAAEGLGGLGRVAESYPHLVFEGFDVTTRGSIGARVVQVLKHLFPPRDDPRGERRRKDGKGAGGGGSSAGLGNRIITFRNVDDVIHVRHHVFVQTSYRSVELAEVGPRFTMRPFEIKSGGSVVDTMATTTGTNGGGGGFRGAGGRNEGLIAGGDVEWHLTQYTRTSAKRRYLGP